MSREKDHEPNEVPLSEDTRKKIAAALKPSPALKDAAEKIAKMTTGFAEAVKEATKPIRDFSKRWRYDRWPNVEEDDFWDMGMPEAAKIIWKQYADVLDGGKGIQAVQAIQKQLQYELSIVRKEIEAIPEDEKDEWWTKRLTGNRFMLEMRARVIERFLTTYSVTGRADRFSDREAQEMAEAVQSKIGAPMSEDVPQDKVQAIVNDLFRDQVGGRLVVEVDGVKHAYQIIHQNGRWGGKANVNQIYKYFEDIHPEMILISERRFKDRIKRTLQDDMT